MSSVSSTSPTSFFNSIKQDNGTISNSNSISSNSNSNSSNNPPLDNEDQEYLFNKIMQDDAEFNKTINLQGIKLSFQEYLRKLFELSKKGWNSFSEEDDERMIIVYQQVIHTANYAKNIVKAFTNYMTTDKSDQIVIESLDPKNGTKLQIMKQYKRYMQPKNINNLQLKKLMENKRFNVHFLYFLQYYTLDYLDNSKSNNRYTHIFFVLFLIRCYFNKSNFKAFVFYKKQANRKNM